MNSKPSSKKESSTTKKAKAKQKDNAKTGKALTNKSELTNKKPSAASKPIQNKSLKKISKSTQKVVFDEKIINRLKKIISNYTEYPELLKNIERNTSINFSEELNIDSVDFVEIIVDTEQEFGITIKDEEIQNINSFEAMYVLIEEKIKSKK